MTALATTLQAFFTERLIRQRQASPHTLAAYRDTLRLLLVFASARKDVEPSKLDIDDLDAPLIGAFLDHLEKQRENSARTRNARLAAVRSLFRYAALRHPEHAAVIERVLAIPRKRFDRRLVTFLIEPELDALFRAPDRSTWTGRRDHTLLTLAAQTGLRASELIGLRISDVHLGTGAHVSCTGKGRKLRITPITSGMVALLRVWLAERAGQPAEPLFVTQSGTSLSRDAVEHRLAKYIQIHGAQSGRLDRKTWHLEARLADRHRTALRPLQARGRGDDLATGGHADLRGRPSENHDGGALVAQVFATRECKNGGRLGYGRITWIEGVQHRRNQPFDLRFFGNRFADPYSKRISCACDRRTSKRFHSHPLERSTSKGSKGSHRRCQGHLERRAALVRWSARERRWGADSCSSRPS
jgi:integrase/recombinase XerD